MNSICFIPAKGNSRRLPRKNVQTVGGKPLVTRAIEGALGAGCFKKICVTSNDEEVLSIAEKAGAESLHRGEDLCRDDIRAKDVVRAHLSEMDETFDCVTMLMPTNPFRTSQHIREAHEIFKEKGGLTLVSVVEYEFNPAMAMIIDEDGSLKALYGEKLNWIREDELPKCYHLNGAIFMADYDFFMNKSTFIDSEIIPYEMDFICSIDVDTQEDLRLAEFYLGGNE